MKNYREKAAMETKYLEEQLKMQKENQKMWEDKWKNHPVTKEIVREYHTKTSSGCSIF